MITDSNISWFSLSDLAGVISVGSEEFWRQNTYGGCWATVIVLVFIFFWASLRGRASRRRSSIFDPPALNASVSRVSISPTLGVPEIVSDADLKYLINALDENLSEENWEDVIHKRNHLMSYRAKCCKPKDGPLKYLSVTTFENCLIELLRDFYMDNEYRKEWDRMLVDHKQLQIDERTGVEIGCTIKKFPLLTPREYVLAWRVWEGMDKTFYCFIRDCEHPQVPKQKKHVRVRYFRSGWRIRKVAGRDACEIAMVHQEDAGLNVEMAKIAFARGIWSYVCKMDSALRKYSTRCSNRLSTPVTALRFVQKVPPELEPTTPVAQRDHPACSTLVESREKINSRKPSKKWIANGLLVVGGLVYLSRGHAGLGAKIAMACILKKLTKHGSASSTLGTQGSVKHL